MQFLEIGVRSTRVAGLDVEMSTFSTEASGIDLALTVVEDGPSLVATWEYDGDLFEACTIERMQRHYLALAESAVADPDSPVWAMRMMTRDEERRQAPPPAAAPQAPALHRVVESWAAAEPAATALVSSRAQLTYGELNTRANQVARALQAQGAGPESVVGVMLPRSIDLPVILLAVLKAGACYLPLDPAYPRERLAFMVEDSGAELVISDEAGLGARTLPPAQLHASADLLSGENLTTGDLTQACAYIIYTSGSTGKPKGVQVTGTGLANVAQAQRRQFGLSSADRVGQFFSASFDASIFEITMAWAAGAALVTTSPDQALPGGELARTFREQAVTAVTMTPTALTALGAADIPSLRIVSAAGEACPPAALRPWRPQARCFNLYGPTEATIWSTAEEASDADADAAALPIGRPIPGVSAYVLDASMNPVPSMVTGELYLGGTGVARAYAGRAALTAERFLPDPFAGEPGARMYRSGDMARKLADGRIEFVGREDDQVKIRGYRIELGEVEAVIGGSPLVRQCAAVADDGRLVCHVVLDEASDEAAAERLRAYMADRLPGHLVPDQVVVRDSLPTLPSGKADRKALRESAAGARLDAESYVAPRTPMEEFLAGLWAEVLNVPRVGVNDDFFAMGGHSLAATLVATRLKADLSLDVPVTLLFEHQDLGAYTQAVLDHAGKTDSEFAATS